MRVNKISKYVGEERTDIQKYIKTVDTDLTNICLALQGRIRFGAGTDNTNGENIAGEWQVFTSNGSANTEDTLAHGLGSVPVGYLVVKQDKAASLYEGGTTWTSTNIYLKSSATSVAWRIFLLK